jgi:hypothetical protein
MVCPGGTNSIGTMPSGGELTLILHCFELVAHSWVMVNLVSSTEMTAASSQAHIHKPKIYHQQ